MQNYLVGIFFILYSKFFISIRGIFMDHRKHNQTDSWDDRVYGTGNTMPPKTQSGIVTLLLILVIFLSGIISALSFLNIKLFQELNYQKQHQDAPPMSFTGLEIDPTVAHHSQDPNPPVLHQEDVQISLNQSPQNAENDGGLSWQDIYEKNIISVVSISVTGETGTMSGSGIIISSRGHIATNYHLIDGAETIAVRFFEFDYEGEDLFPDIDKHWARHYINQAAFSGLVTGYPDTTFKPQQLITRAEAMTIVNRTLDRHPHADHLLPNMLKWPDNMDTSKWYYAQVQEATNSHEYKWC
jgi:hypothetical protein